MAKQVSPGVLALRKVVDDVHKDAREAKKRGELVGWSSSKFPCELAAAFDLNVMYPENQAAGIAANRYGELTITISAVMHVSASHMQLVSVLLVSLTRRQVNTSSIRAQVSR